VGQVQIFVSDTLVAPLYLPITPWSNLLTVNLADSRASIANHSVEADLTVGDFHCRVKCIPTSLQHYDIVLGKPWLTYFNPTLNLRLKSLALVSGTNTHVLFGRKRSDVPDYVLSAIDAAQAVKEGGEGYLVRPSLVSHTHETNSTPPELEELRRSFKTFLSGLPQGLPPSLAEDHQIRLEPNAKPPASRIYPLSGAQLIELRAQLQDLLERGFIRPSTSPYGAPIFFVSKKDGGWWLCIDYRALNRIIVRNQHPLPHVDEMFE
jgi:Retroviral aspartyl protease